MEKIFDFIGRDITQIQMTSNNRVKVWFGLRSQEMTLTEFNYLMIKKKLPKNIIPAYDGLSLKL